MEQISNEKELTGNTEKILNKLNHIYGLEDHKETIKRYAEYLKLKKQGKITLGNYNVLIKEETEYAETLKVIDIIYKLLKANKIISTKYKIIEANEIRENKKQSKINEKLLILETKTTGRYAKEDIEKFIETNKEKIFIIVDKSHDYEFIEEMFNKTVTWKIEIGNPTQEETAQYIKNTIKNNNIKIAKSCNFIETMSKQNFTEVNKDLMEIIIKCKIDNIQTITADVLKEINKKKFLKVQDKEITGMQQLNNLIGLEEVKKQIKQIVNYIKTNKNRGKMPSLHMSFEGNPGTGKTEVSRILGKIFAEEEILSNKKRFVEAQRADLVAKYIGHTAPKTQSMIERAKGGILFIDEAYSLNPKGSDKDYGHECIATLLKGMEDNRENLCVILAGYTKEMEELFEANSGFESRIQFKVQFPDYTSEELYKIFKKMVKDQNYKLSNNLKEILIEYFKIESQKENFANARCVRNIFEKIKFEQAERITNGNDEDINLIKKCDVQNVIGKLDTDKKEKITIGFAS